MPCANELTAWCNVWLYRWCMYDVMCDCIGDEGSEGSRSAQRKTPRIHWRSPGLYHRQTPRAPGKEMTATPSFISLLLLFHLFLSPPTHGSICVTYFLSTGITWIVIMSELLRKHVRQSEFMSKQLAIYRETGIIYNNVKTQVYNYSYKHKCERHQRIVKWNTVQLSERFTACSTGDETFTRSLSL